MNNVVALKVSLPKIPDIELVALEGLDRLAHHMGIVDEKIGEAKVIVTEAIINAFEHSGNPNSSVEVEFTMTKQELTILVKDFGKGFEPLSIEEPDIKKKMGTQDKRGWGLKLMKTMSDDFRIKSDEQGTRITIKKILS